MLLAAVPAMSQSSNGDYMLLVGSGFLCDPGDSSTCPAVVRSAQGDSYEMSGAGTFNTKSKLVTATGTFTRKSSNGYSLETGIWIANELVKFDFYGVAPDARIHAGPAFGPPQFGPRRMPMLSGPMPAGGLAVLHIRLMPMWGVPKTATLQVNCALAKVPANHQTEGIRLAIQGGGVFDDEVSGRTMFISTRPGGNPTHRAPAPDAGPGRTPAQVQR